MEAARAADPLAICSPQVEPDAAVRRLLTERLVEARTPGNISATRLPRGSIICGAPQVVTKSPELLPVVLATATALVRVRHTVSEMRASLCGLLT